MELEPSVMNFGDALVRVYGGKRGFVRHLDARCRHRLGMMRDYVDIDWSTVDRLLLICKGNICRSAYAASKARAMGLAAHSAGLMVKGPATPPAAASNVAQSLGIDLSRHTATPLEMAPIQSTDLILAMEPSQAEEVQRRINAEAQVSLLGLWANPPRPYIHDPFGSTEAYFRTCFSIIDSALIEIGSRMRSCSR